MGFKCKKVKILGQNFAGMSFSMDNSNFVLWKYLTNKFYLNGHVELLNVA